MSKTLWIVMTIAEPFPLNFAHAFFPSEAYRATAKGPFYNANSKRYFQPAHKAHAEWSAEGLRSRGWTVTLTEEYR